MSLKMELEAAGQSIAGICKERDHAIQLCETHTVDVVVADVNLGPGENGMDIARELQAKFGHPILFLSGYEPETIRELTTDLTTIAYLGKPTSVEQILAVTDRFFAHR